MRLRVGAVLCLFLAFWGSGCRKALAPTTLDNLPPETWIVAAPQDTITTRDSNNNPIRPNINKVPVRFHMYWAGSDRDGAVVGFYWAVVETLPIPPENSTLPALPGPKARDYHYTTATDSLFIFTASEQVRERQHAFYIYAVDNKGRPDPTPARFIFSAYDRFPPEAIIDECKATGTEYQLLPTGGVIPVQRTYLVHDFFEISNSHPFPRDTVSSNALLHMRWHGVPTIPSTVVTGYRYKLDEPSFNTVDSSVHESSYNTGVGLDKVNPGPKIFTLRAIGQSGWRGEATRWFQMNFAPDTWFAGADPNDPLAGWLVQPHPFGGKYLDYELTGWPDLRNCATPPGIPGSMLSLDSLTTFPAQRVERKTFFEVYNDRLWIRAENDTVHLNSWVILPTGGFDRDSPYSVKVNTLLLDSCIARISHPVLEPGGPNGSPIGFRIKIQVKDAAGQIGEPSETTTYPVFDPASVFHQPVINGYWGLTAAGKAYAVVRAEDGDGTVDRRVDHQLGQAVGIADRVDAGGGSAEDQALRSKILTFYVNHPPRLIRNGLRPTVGFPISNRAVTFNVPADDDDPLDPTGVNNRVGGRGATPILVRRKIAIIGTSRTTGQKFCYIPDVTGAQFAANIGIITIPSDMATGAISVVYRLCDCTQCDAASAPANCPDFQGKEVSPSQGTCVDTIIQYNLTAPDPPSIMGGDGGAGSGGGGAGGGGRQSEHSPQRPGSTSTPDRRPQ